MNFELSRKYFGVGAIAVMVALVAPLVGANEPKEQLRESFRLEMLALINRDRLANGLSAVKMDRNLSSFADQYCARQIRDRTTGHFTLDGHAPYLRYSLAGGNDGVSENAAAWSANYRFPDSSILDMIRKSHQTMLSERPPHDGHRQTLLDPDATHVALGLEWEGGEFRLVQEFQRRYLDWQRPLPRFAATDERVSAEARALPGSAVEAVSVHFEPLPQEMSRQLTSSIETYGLPRERRELHFANPGQRSSRTIAAAARRNNSYELVRAKDGSVRFDVPLDRGVGLYTVVIWVKRDDSGRSVAASNVSIQVREGTARILPQLGSR